MDSAVVNACINHASNLLVNQGPCSKSKNEQLAFEFEMFGIILEKNGSLSNPMSEDEFDDKCFADGRNINECALCYPGLMDNLEWGIIIKLDNRANQLYFHVPVNLTVAQGGFLFFRKSEITRVSIDKSYIKTKKANAPLISDKQDTFEDEVEEAKKGDSDSQCYVGSSYLSGKDGVERDVDKGLYWLTLSAEQLNENAEYLLGCFYCLGDEVHKDVETGLILLSNASEQGHLDAQLALSKLYYENRLLPKDIVKAKYYLLKAAKQGHDIASAQLANMYMNGEMGSVNVEKAFLCYEHAAKKGVVEAQFNVGLMYVKGQGTKQDFKKAEEWIGKAAQQGFPEAAYNLFLLYSKGYDGVPKDHERAFNCLKKAGALGHKKAKEQLSKLGGLQ